MTDAILLDTHIVLWLDSGSERLRPSTRTLIDAAWRNGGTVFMGNYILESLGVPSLEQAGRNGNHSRANAHGQTGKSTGDCFTLSDEQSGCSSEIRSSKWGRKPVWNQRKAPRGTQVCNSLFMSAVTAWEIALLVDTGRIELDNPVEAWIDRFLDRPGIEAVPLGHRAACRSYRLHALPHRDPADRLLIASAIELRCPLVTYDERIVDFAEAHGQQFGFTTAA